jgi:CheY-like chemotaxis protein
MKTFEMKVSELQFKKVLVVDDCELVRKRLTAELSALGYVVDSVADSVEALKMVLGSKSRDIFHSRSVDGCLKSTQLRQRRRVPDRAHSPPWHPPVVHHAGY